jgi:hypothetical protein
VGAGCTTGSGSANFPHTESVFESYPAALLEGTLSIERNGDMYCPRIEHGTDEPSYLLVLPPNAQVTETSLEIEGETYSLGTILIGGGSAMGLDYESVGCAADSGAWLVAP